MVKIDGERENIEKRNID